MYVWKFFLKEITYFTNILHFYWELFRVLWNRDGGNDNLFSPALFFPGKNRHQRQKI